MRHHEGQDSFYDILSDISLATVGVFVLLFVMLVLLSNRDVLGEIRARGEAQTKVVALKATIESERQKAEAIIRKRTSETARKLEAMEQKLERLRARRGRLERGLDELRDDVRKQWGVKTVSEAQVRELLKESRLVREQVIAARDEVRLRQNHVRQEFNIYKEKLGKRPYLEFRTAHGPDTAGVARNWIMLRSQGKDHGICKEDFRVSVLRKINAGSGFYFRYVGKEPCPRWVDELLESEGWPAAVEDGM